MGAVIVAALTVFMSIWSEARQNMATIPLIIVFTVMALNRLRLPRYTLLLVVACCVITTRTWLLVNVDPEVVHRWNMPPWMPTTWYLILLPASVAAALLFYTCVLSPAYRCGADESCKMEARHTN